MISKTIAISEANKSSEKTYEDYLKEAHEKIVACRERNDAAKAGG
jgi:hypothetical protein